MMLLPRESGGRVSLWREQAGAESRDPPRRASATHARTGTHACDRTSSRESFSPRHALLPTNSLSCMPPSNGHSCGSTWQTDNAVLVRCPATDVSSVPAEPAHNSPTHNCKLRRVDATCHPHSIPRPVSKMRTALSSPTDAKRFPAALGSKATPHT